ncbi:MAG: hypothetical protein E7456_03585 [Ruminococcaceae bacterium]|nr:hypothetical protein [Oscillospiraceae bacterium]
MVYLALPPESIKDAPKQSFGHAYMTYRISNTGRLLRANTTAEYKGGLMYIDDNGAITGSGFLPGEIVRECMAHGFSGVVLDLSPGFPQDAALSISAVCVKHKLSVYVPPHFAHCPNSIVMLSTGISVGSLNGKLTSGIRQYGPDRVAVMLDYVRRDYTLPAKEENVQELTDSQLNALITKYRSPSFFSKELCTYYFTYRTANKAHLVLYDNAVSMKRKSALSESLGIKHTFMFYPHVKDILDRIFAK